MRIFITGLSGTLGTAVKDILKSEHTLFGLSRCENKAKRLFEEGHYTYIGDVTDFERLTWAISDCKPDIIFHFAALKHVDILENHIEMCINTNIKGTINILKAQRENNVPKLVFSSTDKAVYPVNVYGMCKAISERLVLKNPNNVVCRYGNVLGSNGSVLNTFKKDLPRAKITDKDMTRFWIKIEDAAKFVVNKGLTGSGLCIPEMKAFKVIDLARLVGATEFEYIGIRPGEKLHECLDYDLYSNTCVQYTDKEMKDLL